MNFYTQAFGSLIALIVCLYGYVYGQLELMGDFYTCSGNFIGLILGYILYPLCLLSFFSSFGWLIKASSESFIKLNKYLVHTTVILGLIGCKYFFIAPALLILYSYYYPVLFEKDIEDNKKKKLALELLDKNISYHTIIKLLDISYEDILTLK